MEIELNTYRGMNELAPQMIKARGQAKPPLLLVTVICPKCHQEHKDLVVHQAGWDFRATCPETNKDICFEMGLKLA